MHDILTRSSMQPVAAPSCRYADEPAAVHSAPLQLVLVVADLLAADQPASAFVSCPNVKLPCMCTVDTLQHIMQQCMSIEFPLPLQGYHANVRYDNKKEKRSA